MADENNTPELSPVEQQALEQGWVPKDQWDGDPDLWRPAKEFVDRGELFKKIDDVKRENKQLRQGLEELSKHHARVREVEYERALATLKAQKREALAEGDLVRADELDDKIDEAKEKQRAEAAQPPVTAAPEPDPRFTAWLGKNPWYNTDRAMKAVADETTKELLLRGTRDPEVILAEVEKTVKKEFAHKFTNPKRERAGAVDGGGTNKSSSKSDNVDMNEVEKTIMNKILRVTPGLTKEKYLEEFKATKARGG